jgi:hypothetical protein
MIKKYQSRKPVLATVVYEVMSFMAHLARRHVPGLQGYLF